MIITVVAFFANGAHHLILEFLQNLESLRLPLLLFENTRTASDVSCQRRPESEARTHSPYLPTIYAPVRNPP